MSKSIDICVVGPRTLVGETLLEILEERAFPAGKTFFLDVGEGVAETVTFEGIDHGVLDIDDFDFATVNIAFFCADAAVAKEYVPRATAAGCLVIDDSDAFRMEPDVPLVVPEINPEALGGFPRRNLVSSPNSCATILASVLKPIRDAAGLERIDVVTMQSVSGAGRAGVEELARQSMGLFNQSPMENAVFPKTIAFNLLPQIGAVLENGFSSEEMKVVLETRKLLGMPELDIAVTCVRVPVFYGHSVVAHVLTRKEISLATANAMLRDAKGLVLCENQGAETNPSPVQEAASSDLIFVGRLRHSLAEKAKGLSFWAVSDNMRKGAALNCVQIAEILVQDYLH